MRTKFKFWAVEYLRLNLKNQFILDSFDQDAFIEFITKKPTYLEIGPGKGRFIIEIAKKYPDYNYLVVELNPTISGMCLKAIDDNELENVKLINGDFYRLIENFDNHRLKGIFLNFSDPWPKKRHEKRRLTSQRFLNAYANILNNEDLIYLKTDNKDFFEYSLEQFDINNFELVYKNEDYKEENEFDAMTEFEDKFLSQGIKINKAIFKVNDATLKGE